MKRCKEEKEGKCRCCYRYCNKLFKGIDFLRKHLKSKHPDFAEDDFVAISAPFMRTRFEADDISARPLPPVYVETKGRAEVKSVKEILEKVMVASSSSAAAVAASSMMMPPPPPPLPAGMGRMGGFDQQQQGFRHHAGGGGRGGGEFRKRGHDPRDQRAAGMHSSGRGGGGGFGPQSQAAGQYVEPRSEDNHSRKIASYLDVDAPKVPIQCDAIAPVVFSVAALAAATIAAACIAVVATAAAFVAAAAACHRTRCLFHEFSQSGGCILEIRSRHLLRLWYSEKGTVTKSCASRLASF